MSEQTYIGIIQLNINSRREANMKRLLLFLIMLAAMITYFPQGVRAADGYYSVTFVAEGGTVVVGETRCGTPYTMEVSQGGGIYKRITAESFETN